MFPRRWHRALGLLVLCAACLLTGRAYAQASEADRTAAARSFFHEGLEFADKGSWSEAADRFQRALALRSSPAVSYNLATALIHLGRFIEASEQLRAILRDPTASSDMKATAQTSFDDLSPRIGRLTVNVEGDRKRTKIHLDTREVLDAELGVALPVNPGTHRVSASRDESVVAERSVDIAQGGKEEIVLSLPPAPNESLDHTLTPQDNKATKRSSGGLLTKWWFWTAAGVVVVGATAAVVLLATSDSHEAPVQGNFQPGVLVWP